MRQGVSIMSDKKPSDRRSIPWRVRGFGDTARGGRWPEIAVNIDPIDRVHNGYRLRATGMEAIDHAVFVTRTVGRSGHRGNMHRRIQVDTLWRRLIPARQRFARQGREHECQYKCQAQGDNIHGGIVEPVWGKCNGAWFGIPPV